MQPFASVVRVIGTELASVQATPLLTTARYLWLLIALVNVYDVEVLTISVQLAPPSKDVCHLTTLPVWPDNVIIPELVVLHKGNVPL
jgi:hypothetical protein